jgi:GrpB-like predicted nucleotidyltransferase (UPF0157 family)
MARKPPAKTARPGADGGGEPRPRTGLIDLHEYDPSWPRVFEREATRITGALGDAAIAVEHVGSTSVPRLAAKHVIDIALVVADSGDEPAYVAALEGIGYVLCIREPDWFEHRMLRSNTPRVNLHVFSAGCEEVDRMVLFRDWLREDTADRELYERTKRDLAAKRWADTQEYADAKTLVIEEIVARARKRRVGR